MDCVFSEEEIEYRMGIQILDKLDEIMGRIAGNHESNREEGFGDRKGVTAYEGCRALVYNYHYGG